MKIINNVPQQTTVKDSVYYHPCCRRWRKLPIFTV